MWDNFEVLQEEEVFNDTFSINTVFRIKSGSGAGTQLDPRLCATFSNKRIAIAIDSTLVIFENEAFSDGKSLNFDAKIDCLTVSSDGSLIICGLSNGSICGVHFRGMPVFNIDINESDVQSDGKTFVGVVDYNSEYFFCCTNGKVYKVHNIANDEISKTMSAIASNENAANLNETLSNNVLLDLVVSKRTKVNITTYSVTLYEGELLHVFGGDDYIFLRNDRIDHIVSTQKTSVKQLQGNPMILLFTDQEGHLLELCPYTNIFVPLLVTSNIKEFIMTESNDNNGIELLALVEDGNNLYLKNFEYPSMECKFTLPISEKIWLITQPKSAANIFYLCGVQATLMTSHRIDLRMVSESQPEKRLQTLLAKGLIDEAEEFAKKFNLDLQPVYESKAKMILQDIGQIDRDDREAAEKRFDDLISIAKLITNTNFLLKLRDLEMTERGIMKKLLQFLSKHVILSKDQSKVGEEIKEQLLRLNTLQLIDPNECDMHWQKFVQHQNIGNYCFKFLETDISVACLILKQHASSIIPHLKEKTVLKVLDTIPQQVEPFGIIQWMRHYFPLVSEAYPATTPCIVDWVIKKTKSFQCLDQWPDIGVEFSNTMLDVFKNVKYTFADKRRQYDQSLEKLRNIIHTLEELLVLKQRYNLHISFEDYYKSSIEDCGFSLLQRINIRNLPNLVNNFLFAIFNEHQKSIQETIIKYMDYLINNRKAINVWQERAVVCLQLIRHYETKLKISYRIAKAAPVPWTDTLKPVIELGSASHPISKNILEEYKLQELKLLRSKYGWNTSPSDSDNSNFFRRMVKLNRDELFEDLAVFKRHTPDRKDDVNLTCAFTLARDDSVGRAMDFLRSLDEVDANHCYICLARLVPQVMDDYINRPMIHDRFIEVLKFVKNKNIGNENVERIDDLINLNLLRKSALNMNISFDVLSDEKQIDHYTEIGIEKLIACIHSFESNVVASIWTNLGLLANALKRNKFDIVLKLARKVGYLQFTTILARSFLDESDENDPKNIEMAVLLVKQQYNELMDESYAHHNENVTFAYAVAHRYAQKYHLKEKDTSSHQITYFTNIGANAFDLSQIEEFFEGNVQNDDEAIRNIFDNLIDEKPTISSNRRNSMSIFEEVNRANPVPVIEQKTDTIIKTLSILLYVLIHDLKADTPLCRYFNKSIVKSETLNRSKLITSLEQLIKMRLYTTVFSVVHLIRCQQSGSERLLLAKSMEKTLIRKILKSALHQKEPQFHLLVPMLRSDPDPEEALNILKADLKSGLTKINCLQLSEKYNESIGNSTISKTEKETRLKYHYSMQLRQLDPGLKDDFEINSFVEMFRDLNNKILDTVFLGRMSADFDWNYQKVLIAQITTILRTQELEFETVVDEMGLENLVINVSADKIHSLCNPYIDQISDTKLLAKCLYDFIDAINPYFYEMFSVVIDILDDIHELREDMKSWEKILLFLKHKMVRTRSRRVGQFENDWWLRKQGDSGVMPKISKFRLPFLMIVTEALQDILGEQVTIQDCVEWFPLIRFHSEMQGIHDKDMICREQDTLCITAFKQAMNEVQLNERSSGTWRLQPTNDAFLQSVLFMVKHMTDIERIALVLYMAFNNTHEGADQVEAAHECYQFVMEHESELIKSPRSKDIVNKIRTKYPILKAQHQLHLYGLYDDDLSTLITNPTELIKALYSRSNVVRGDMKCNLNEMAKKFADIFELNFNNIQTNLLKSWLSFTADDEGNALDQTFYDDMNATLSPTRDNYEVTNDGVERAYYILKSWEPLEASHFIVNHLFSEQDESSMNTGRQLQLYECLIKLANENTDESFVSFVDKSKYIALKCIHYLKPFGFKLSIEKFQNYDKLKILKQVWSSHATNPKALNVMTYICMGYDLYEQIIWNGVLRQMVALHMHDELREIIDKISIQSTLVHSDGLLAAYEYLIRLPFQNVIKIRSNDQDRLMCESLFMLQSCPVKHKMNLMDLAKTCVTLKQPHVAGLLIALVEEEFREDIFNMVKPYRGKELQKEINDLEEYGIYPFVTKQAVKLLSL